MDLAEQLRPLAPTLSKGVPAVYILRLVPGALYTGSTLDLPQRMADHMAGLGCATTRDERPLTLLFVSMNTKPMQGRKLSHSRPRRLFRHMPSTRQHLLHIAKGR
jgi:hypothetical protein